MMARSMRRATAPRRQGRTPRTGRIAPVSESSPRRAVPARLCAGILPSAARVAAAMATSKEPPLFLRSAGARLTVMTYSLTSIWSCWSAARTRTRLSRTLASGKPTIWKLGIPRLESTSTRMGKASIPRSVKVSAAACMPTLIARVVPRTSGGNYRGFLRRRGGGAGEGVAAAGGAGDQASGRMTRPKDGRALQLFSQASMAGHFFESKPHMPT